eukprot:gnl/MRDRNA2_/MRDRNA2_28153_c0_seq1.p1 gnl/MRDRNA2_/MRDRNA2_28153_c0~~gnl/MRDRNA2_/MRDRNA2_28153_c0_seq1.p1  ORF type:complete len:232 (+),score=50.55 gnl/MRDRNA2_/MRDRNA2_28153_c0_seq1:90-785(+)
MIACSFASYASNCMRNLNIGGTSLKNDLTRITDSSFIDIPSQFREQLFIEVIKESCQEHGRRVIMNHVHQCLADVTKEKTWKRIYGAMIVMEELLNNGSPALLSEISVGLHFDVIQKLALLEFFQHASNQRAKFMVRSKAQALRNNLVKQLKSCGTKICSKDKECETESDVETDSTCSPTGSLAGSVSSRDSAGSAAGSLPQVKPMFDFEDLMEWAETDDYDSDCEDSCSD